MIGDSRTKHRLAITLMALLGLASAGCGAMFGSKRRAVTITSTPAGAEAIVDGQLVGTTPVVVSLADNTSHEVLFRHGQGQAVCRIDSSVDATWLILDILAFPIGVVVDGVTGEWKELDQAGCHGILPASAPPPQVSPNPPGQGYRPPSSAPHVPYTPDTLPQEKP